MTAEEVGWPMLHTFVVAVRGTTAWIRTDGYESRHSMAVEYATSVYSRPKSIPHHSMGMALWDNEMVFGGVEYRETSPIIITLLPKPPSLYHLDGTQRRKRAVQDYYFLGNLLYTF